MSTPGRMGRDATFVGLLAVVDQVLAMHREDERVTLSRKLVLELRACAVACASLAAPPPAPAGVATPEVSDDTRRLDWLASRGFVAIRCHGEGLFSIDTDNRSQVRSATGLREAIDAAMADTGARE